MTKYCASDMVSVSERPPSLKALAWANGEELTRWVERTGARHRQLVSESEEAAEKLLASINEELGNLELMPADTRRLMQALRATENISPEQIEALKSFADRDAKRGLLIQQLRDLSSAIAQMSKCRQAVTVGAAAVMTTALQQLVPASRAERDVTPTRRKLGLAGALGERETVQAVEVENVTDD